MSTWAECEAEGCDFRRKLSDDDVAEYYEFWLDDEIKAHVEANPSHIDQIYVSEGVID